MKKPESFEEFFAELRKHISYSNSGLGIEWGVDKILELWASVAEPQEFVKGIPPDNRNVVIKTEDFSKRKHFVIGKYIHPRSEEASFDSEYMEASECIYDEDKDIYYLPEGWYEQSLYGSLNIAYWFIHDKVIGWRPLPKAKEEGK